ncbi:M50 family metallopeptidase [Leuconostocaceae bacterium ESL0723]|nr:M50 family metallopeptidase [Leuconostocaceae bacterium ESL0723]
MIFVHELGHTVVAKLLGVKLLDFNIFGFSWQFQSHELKFQPNLSTLFGSVGMKPSGTGSRMKYVATLLAGPGTNLLLALLFFVFTQVPGAANLIAVNFCLALTTGLPLSSFDNDGEQAKLYWRYPDLWQHAGLIDKLYDTLRSSDYSDASFEKIPAVLDYIAGRPFLTTRNILWIGAYLNDWLILRNSGQAGQQVVNGFWSNYRRSLAQSNDRVGLLAARGEFCTADLILDGQYSPTEMAKFQKGLPRAYRTRLDYLADPQDQAKAERYRELIDKSRAQVGNQAFAVTAEEAFYNWGQERLQDAKGPAQSTNL